MPAGSAGKVVGPPLKQISPPGYESDPNTGLKAKTPVHKATQAGEALNALAKITGMPLLGSSSGSSTGYGGGMGGTGTPAMGMPDTTGATSAAFARGKDQAGSTARAALTALQEEMAGRNMLGSGQEAMATADVINRAGAGVNELTREQAIKDATFANAKATEQYRGNITMRGQDLNAAQEAQRQQQQALQGLLSVISSGGLLY